MIWNFQILLGLQKALSLFMSFTFHEISFLFSHNWQCLYYCACSFCINVRRFCAFFRQTRESKIHKFYLVTKAVGKKTGRSHIHVAVSLPYSDILISVQRLWDKNGRETLIPIWNRAQRQEGRFKQMNGTMSALIVPSHYHAFLHSQSQPQRQWIAVLVLHLQSLIS